MCYSRQINRWNAIRRHVRQVKINCEPGDQRYASAERSPIPVFMISIARQLGRGRQTRLEPIDATVAEIDAAGNEGRRSGVIPGLLHHYLSALILY